MVGVVQLVGASSHNQKVEGLIPGQGIYLDCLLLSLIQVGTGATHLCFSMASVFLFLPSSLSKSNEKNVLGWE